MTKEHKERIGLANALTAKKAWAEGRMPKYVLNNLHFGSIPSEKGMKSLKEFNSNRWKNGEVTEKQKQTLFKKGFDPKRQSYYKKGHEVPKEWREAVKKSRVKQIFPKKDTAIEVKIQNYLKQLDIQFFTHQYINEIEYSYQCDIFIPIQNGISKKTIIECDGDYWHGNLDIYSINKLHKSIIIKRILNYERTAQLEEQGFRVIRLWEHEIKILNINQFKEVIAC